MSTGIRPEYDPRTLMEYITQIRAADPTTPISELNDYVRSVSGGTHRDVSALKRAAMGRGQAAAPADATGAFSAAREEQAREQSRLNTGRNMARSALRGLTFNLDDNIARTVGVGTAPGGMYSPEGEADFRQYQSEFPLTDLGMGILGGAPVPLGAFSKVAKGAGLLPRMAAGAKIGAAAGALAGAGDAESPVNNGIERVKGALFGGAFGAAGGAILPAVGAGAAATGRKARRLVDGAYAGQQDVLGAVERLGNIGPDGMPIGKNARFYDDEGRARNLGIGMRRLGQQMDQYVSGDRAAITPVGALDAELQTMSVNAVRNDPGTAAAGRVQDVAEMGAGSGARMQGDAQTVRMATGQNPVPVRPRATAQQMADNVGAQRGPVPGVPAPDARARVVPFPSRNATERIDVMRTNLQNWAASPEGFAGLRAMPVRPLASEIAPHVQAMDNLVPYIGDKRAADAVANVANVVRMLGEPGFNVDDARNAVSVISDAMEKGFPVDGGKPIRLTTAQLGVMDDARRAITTAVDAQTRGSFTPIMREYAQRNRLIEGVERGREIFRNRASLTPEDIKSEIDDLSSQFPEVRTEVMEGMASELISALRASPEKGKQNLVQKLVAAARSDENKKIAMLFPSQKKFQDWMMRAYLMNASQDGAKFLTSTSVSELSALMRGLTRTASNPAERAALKKAFADGLYARMQEQWNTPERTQTLVREMAEAGNAQMRTKVRMVFGKRGGDEMLRRAGLERTLTDFSRRVENAVANPSNIGDVRGEQAMIGNRNPISALGNVAGAARTALAKPAGRAASSAIADVLFTPGEEGMRKLQTLYQQDLQSRAVRIPGLLPALGGVLGGRVGSGARGLLAPPPEPEF